jgi:hypothetical protein
MYSYVLRNGLLFVFIYPFIRNHFRASFQEPEYGSLRLGIGAFQLRSKSKYIVWGFCTENCWWNLVSVCVSLVSLLLFH